MMRAKAFTKVVGAVTTAVALFAVGCGGGGSGSFTDSRDGKKYRTVKIGEQVWMAENLNFATDEGSWCYDDDESNCNTYGRLYDWNTARTACPVGWRLPNDAEWDTLVDSIGSTATYAGRKLKSQSGWQNDGNGTDEFGFSALPGGRRWLLGSTFQNIGSTGRWWTATENNANLALARTIYGDYDNLDWLPQDKNDGFSVRCIRE